MGIEVNKQKYIIFDEKACNASGVENSTVKVICNSIKKARMYKGIFGRSDIYTYDIDTESFQWVEDI